MKASLKLLPFFLLVVFISCKNTQPVAEKSGYQGQGPNPVVSTKTKPVQKQWKGIWSFQDPKK